MITINGINTIKRVNVNDLDNGTLFICGDDLYMKVARDNSSPYNCVCINDGYMWNIVETSSNLIVNAEINIIQ